MPPFLGVLHLILPLLIGWRCCDAWRGVRPVRLCEAADEIDTCRTASADVVCPREFMHLQTRVNMYTEPD